MRIFLILGLMISSSFLLPEAAVNGDVPLPSVEAAFARSGAAFSYAVLSAWTTRLTPHATAGEDGLWGDLLAQRLGMAMPRETQGPSYVRFASNSRGTSLVVETVVLASHVRETVYSVDRRTNTLPGENAIGALTAPLEALGLNPRVAVNLVGESKGDLRRRGRGLILSMFGKGHVQLASSITSGPYWSVEGDLPDGGPAVLVAGRPVNLQVALSYDRRTDHTQVTVGSPLITVTY